MMLRLKKRQDETQNTDVQEQPRRTEKQRQNAVVLYMAALFAVVILIIVMSWFSQQRRNDKTISDLTEQHNQVHIQALENIEALQADNIALAEKVGALEDELAQANEKIEALTEKYENVKAGAEADLAAERERSAGEKRELEDKYALLSNLLRLEKSVAAGKRMTAEDVTAARAAADSIAPLADKLSEDENELYLRCLEMLEAAGEKTNKEN